MGKLYEEISQELAEWIQAQHLFFITTAPNDPDGHINCSPKGLDTFRILGPHRVAYLDLTGSGAETIAHVRENGRITVMFCAMNGPPKIVRLYGKAEIILPSSDAWNETSKLFPTLISIRSIIQIDLTRIYDSCGYGVPKYEYTGERPTLEKSAEKKGVAGMVQYRQTKNRRSIDDLPALDPEQTE